MSDKTFLQIEPVMPSRNIEKDIAWYDQYLGFKPQSFDDMYAVLKRDHLYIHLQWHADNEDDPLLGGSVIKLFVKGIDQFFEEFVKRGAVNPDKLRKNTPWGTHEFGFYDLNKNAIYIVEDA